MCGDDLLADFRIEAAKRVSWEQVLSALRIEFKRKKISKRIVAKCIAHKEKTPSLLFWESSGGYKCHGCGWHGDMVHFVAYQLDIRETDIVALQRFFIPLYGKGSDPLQIPLSLDKND